MANHKKPTIVKPSEGQLVPLKGALLVQRTGQHSGAFNWKNFLLIALAIVVVVLVTYIFVDRFHVDLDTDPLTQAEDSISPTLTIQNPESNSGILKQQEEPKRALPQPGKPKKDPPEKEEHLSPDSPENVVRLFIQYIGSGEHEEAAAIHLYYNEDGYKDITSTELASINTSRQTDMSASVSVDYTSYDPVNDLKRKSKHRLHCKEAGIRYYSKFILKKETD